MITAFVRSAVSAVRQPRQGAGNDHGVKRVVAEVAPVLPGELRLLFRREVIPSFARRQGVKDLVETPGSTQTAGELAVCDLEAECRVLFFRRRIASFVI